MSTQPRNVKVFAVLLASVVVVVIVLMALGNNPVPVGAFSLADYRRLDPVEKTICSRVAQSGDYWKSVEIYYSGTKAGNIQQLASLNGLAGPSDVNCHFVICNGLGGKNGQIQPTEKWQRQWPAIPNRDCSDNNQTIRICIVSDGKSEGPTDFQIKRAETLVENLCREFEIQPEFAYYPDEW